MVHFDNESVTFYSDSKYFHKELNGIRTCTMKLVSHEDLKKIRKCKNIQILFGPLHPQYFSSNKLDAQVTFFNRVISDISIMGQIVDKVLILISWVHEKEDTEVDKF